MSILFTLLRLVIPSALATNIENLGAGSPGINEMWGGIKGSLPHSNLGGQGVTFVTLKITNIILQMIGGIAVAVIVYAGIRMIIARGNDEGLNEAKKILTYTIFGLIFVLGADAIVNYAMVLVTQASQ